MMKYFIAVICCLLSAITFAQDTTAVKEATSGLRAHGKIYVVLTVVITILLGLTIYLVTLDRKIGRMEKQNL